MLRIVQKGVLAHRVRYVLTALAALLGVAFIAGTLVLTDSINATFNGLYDQVYQGTAAVVRAKQPFNPGANFTNQRDRIDAALATKVEKVPGVAAVSLGITGYAQLVGRNGKPIGKASNGPPTLGVAWSDVAALNPLRLLPGGRAPRSPDEVVIDKHSADVGHYAVGDRVTVLSQLPPAAYTVVGIATWGSADSPLGASITAFEPTTAARVLGEPGKVDQIDVQAAPGVAQAQLVHRIEAVIHDPKVEVVTGRAITTESQDAVHQALSFFNTFLLVFAFIALFVGSFIIFNTFSITVAQRMRELGLLRAVGASRRQVTTSVLGESLIVGVAASVAGLAVGIGLAFVLKAGLAALGLDLPSTGLVVSPRTVLVGLLVGIGVTLAAALLPARRAGRVPPVAAIQMAAAGPARLSRRRIVRGALLTGVGVVVLGTAFVGRSWTVQRVGLGVIAVYLGVVALGPVLASRVSRLLGAPLAKRRVTGKIAQQNAMRNPQRTASTAAALMVGVALVSLIAILASSTKASVNATLGSSMKADFVINSGATAGAASGLSPDIERSLAALPEVSTASGVRSGVAQIYGKTTPVVATDVAKSDELFDVGVVHGDLTTMTSEGIAVSDVVANAHHLRVGSGVALTYATTGTHLYTVQAVYTARLVAGDYVLPLAAAQANFPQNLDVDIFVKLAPGVSASAGRAAVEGVMAAYPDATVLDQAQYKAQQSQQVDQLLNLVYGLLALAVIIAFIGIANTLALSIYERIHELGLLRAVGMTRGQLRSAVRTESFIISSLGALEGLAMGVLFGCTIVTAMRAQGVTELVVPVPELLIVGALAGLAGIVAAMAPGNRAARLDVLRAVASE